MDVLCIGSQGVGGVDQLHVGSLHCWVVPSIARNKGRSDVRGEVGGVTGRGSVGVRLDARRVVALDIRLRVRHVGCCTLE